MTEEKLGRIQPGEDDPTMSQCGANEVHEDECKGCCLLDKGHDLPHKCVQGHEWF